MNQFGVILFIGVVLVSSLNSLFLFYSRNPTTGQFDFSFTSIPLNTEVLKFFLSSFLFLRQHQTNDPSLAHTSITLTGSLYYLVPALIYAVKNNVQLSAYQYLSPVHLVPLNNFKLIWTAILWRIFFKRKISNLRKAALLVLIVGCVVSQMIPCVPEDHTHVQGDTENSGKTSLASSSSSSSSKPSKRGGYRYDQQWIGVSLMMLDTLLSAVAGVYTEALMKKSKLASIHSQNMQMYAYGIVVTLVLFLMQTNNATGAEAVSGGPFKGYNKFTFFVLFNTAIEGMLISGLLKYVDNIAKIFTQSVSMAVVTVFGVIFMGFEMNWLIIMGLLNICVSLWLYYVAAPNLVDKNTLIEKESGDEVKQV